MRLVLQVADAVAHAHARLVVHRDLVKQRLIDVMKQEILATVPEKVRTNKSKFVVPVES